MKANFEGTKPLPIQVYEIWEYDNRVLGSKIDHKPAFQVKRDYPVCYDLRGREAHFIIVSNDLSLTRMDAVNFAHAIHRGLFKNINVDLSPCQPKRK